MYIWVITLTLLGVTFMNTANFMCDPGYELKGNSFWICSSQGFWVPENEDGSGSGFESSWTGKVVFNYSLSRY